MAVTYSCVTPPTYFASLNVTVTQYVGKRQAQGGGHGQTPPGGELVCDGLLHTTNVVVSVSSGSIPFKPGKAAVSAA